MCIISTLTLEIHVHQTELLDKVHQVVFTRRTHLFGLPLLTLAEALDRTVSGLVNLLG